MFVQLVAENEAGRTEGDIVEITRPSLLVPIISRPVVIARTKNTAKVRFRTNTMGEWGELSGSIYNSEGGNVASQEVLIGRQEAARETILIFDGLTPDASYQGEAVAINAHGKSLSCSFTVPAEEI
ncbi:MAG: hypothetical protein HOF84_02000 [Rhodospirillales bacterium]|nr:hypothetical protein [Rhodospirillales bacterium]